MRDTEILKYKLHDETAKPEMLQMYLDDAEQELKNFLRYSDEEELPEKFNTKKIELAKLYYQKDKVVSNGKTSESYSEGQISESAHYIQSDGYDEMIDKLFNSLMNSRRVGRANRT